ncbi:hypothetical protein NM208_g7804 [Fusarium decemcellulare]|uniref:Uncharacterized protein n=1 Tax=Fusarium decemcellulare TaxID=57161 RepID=A0ACC1S7M8_9HYPO|nr:hypothetical protein NM208_g7804 [Fusarium decemcellulare]
MPNSELTNDKCNESVLNNVEYLEASYDANFFFWYFEARNNPDTAPTALYLAGGPGASAFDLLSSFPCNYGDDSNSTTINPWSWSNNVNMLYVDQPIGTGFSYAERSNGTVDTLNGEAPIFKALEEGEPLPETNATFLAGTMDPRRNETTQNTTVQTARTLWQFSQVWFQEFPEYKTENKEISAWGISYCGYWAPAFFSYILNQNDLIKANKHPNENATTLSLGTLGIANGCIDMYSQAMSAPQMAYNNTYGIKAYSEEVFKEVTKTVPVCQGLLDKCRSLRAKNDPHGLGKDDGTNEACRNASEVCFFAFDLTYYNLTNEVSEWNVGYYNQDWVQRDLGVRVNWTVEDYTYQQSMFVGTADAMISDLTPLEHVLQRGINVAFVYGDRDYQCNWMGAETVSLTVDYPSASDFRAAGYEDIVTNSSYKGGLVRQSGSFSFSRVFDAGHAIAFYQPETTDRIFQRAMFGKDVATGDIDVDSEYNTEGPSEVWSVKNKIPETSPENVCYTYHAFRSCTDEQRQALANGTAVVKNFVAISPKGVNLENDTAGGQAAGDGDQEDDGTDKASTGVRLKGAGLGILMGSFMAMCLCSAIVS